MTNKEIRATARARLGNNIFSNTWLMCVVVVLIFSAIISIAGTVYIGTFIVIGPLSIGLVCIFLSLVRGNDNIEIGDLFNGFKSDFGENLLLGLMTSIFIFLWSLLFIIPGIVKAYSYSMAYYIKNDHPEYSWRECIDESRRITNGKKLDLFLLDLSFIGWIIVGTLAFGIGVLWVEPYMQAARAVFYETIKEQ